MKRTCKRLTALVLALAMCFSLLSATAWAADVEAEESVDEVVTEEVEEEPAEEIEEEEAEETVAEEKSTVEESEKEDDVSAFASSYSKTVTVGGSTSITFTLSANYSCTVESADNTIASASITGKSTTITSSGTTYGRTVTIYGYKQGDTTVKLLSGSVVLATITVTVVPETITFECYVGDYYEVSVKTLNDESYYVDNENITIASTSKTKTTSTMSITVNGSTTSTTVVTYTTTIRFTFSEKGNTTFTLYGSETGAVLYLEGNITKKDQSITASIGATKILMGETTQISASAEGTLSYASSNTDVAVVDKNGLVTGIGEGKSTIYVTAAETDKYEQSSMSFTVTVVDVVDISTCTVSLSSTSYTYDGTAKKPTVTVKDGSTTLTKNTDYTVSYSNNISAGTATVTVTGTGSYTGTVTKTFTISKASQTVTATADAASIYAGKTTTITASTTGDGAITYASSDTSIATVSSSGMVTGKKPGTVTITVQAASTTNYNAATQTVTITVKLNKTTISSLTNTSSGITVKWSKITGASGYYIYRKTSGGSYSKIATVKSGSTVSYTDTAVKSKNGTTYVYAVRAYCGTSMGSYTGKTTVRLTGVSISSLKNVKTKKMTVKWKKNSKATGYQIQYSTSSSFSSYKTVTVSSYKTVSKTISSLTKGKKYYVRVRAYKTVSGTKYYSAWSSTKNVKISK